MYTKDTVIKNKTGLHARPASEFVKCAKQFSSVVSIGRVDNPTMVNAKSIVMLLTLALAQGSYVKIQAEGDDEQMAVDTLIALIDSGFSEKE